MFIFIPRILTLGKGTPKLRITMDIGRERLSAPATQLRMVIYDIDEYITHQKQERDTAQELNPDTAIDPVDFETDLSHFTGFERTPHPLPSRSLILREQFRAPTPAEGNGVLAVANLVFRRTETPTERRDQRQLGEGPWYVNEVVGGDFTSHLGTEFRIEVHMFTRRDENGTFGQGTLERKSIGTFAFNQNVLATVYETTRKLAVRLISPVAQGPLQPGSIALSSLHPRENAANAGTVNSRAVRVDVAAAQQHLLHPGAATPIDPGEVGVPSRQATPDLTGWYELVVEAEGVDTESDEYLAPAAMWISQAGQAIVGWYYPMSALGMSAALLGEAANHVPSARRICLISSRSSSFPEGADIFWCFADDDEDPSELLANLRFPDPNNPVRIKTGRFDIAADGIITELDFLFSLAWVLSIEEDPVEDADTQTRVARFRRSLPGKARIPWVSIEQMRGAPNANQAAVDEIVRSRVEPVPSGLWIVIGRHLRSEMETCIHDYSQSSDNHIVVQAAFERAGQIVNEIVEFFPNAQYREEALNWVRHHCKSIELPDHTGDNARPLEEWLIEICERHLELQMEERREELGVSTLPPEERTAIVEGARTSNGRALEDLGVLRGDAFEYEFQFSALAAGFSVVVGLSIGACICIVTKYRLVGGTRELDYTVTLLGIFGGVGAGFSWTILAGAGGSAGGASPPNCTIRSFHNIAETNWGHVTFSIAAVATGITASTPVVTVDMLRASSTLLSLTVHRDGPNFLLSAIVEEAGPWNFSAAEVNQIIEKIEEGKLADAQASLFSISESVGYMYPVDSATYTEVPPEDLPIVPDQNTPIDAFADSALVYFATGSSVIQQEHLLDLDRRLAMYRSLFTEPGWYWCVGFGDPRWESRPDDADAQNIQLSRRRAEAADAALGASLGAPGGGIIHEEKQHVDPHGAGRSIALLPEEDGGGGLHDPYDPATPSEVRKREEREEYPKWRRVDIVINGTLIARVKAP